MYVPELLDGAPGLLDERRAGENLDSVRTIHVEAFTLTSLTLTLTLTITLTLTLTLTLRLPPIKGFAAYQQ